MANRKLVFLLEYNGSAFHGSQKQHNNPKTIEATLEDAFRQLGIPVEGPIHFSGRTDAGVHAKGQVVDVTLSESRRFQDPYRIKMALNGVLSENLAIRSICWSDPSFHATIMGKWRWYRYRLYLSKDRTVWLPPDSLWLYQDLDIEAMAKAAQALIGTHSFTSFKAPRAMSNFDQCTVISSCLYQSSFDPKMIHFDIVANRFLYRMVRIIMGTLVNIGKNTRKTCPKQDVFDIIEKQQRVQAGPTMKPNGLSLMGVYYPEPWDFFQNDLYVKTLTAVLQEPSSDENLYRQI